ncbi:FAD-binding protein [Lysobacter sp. A3-1-A15]|uniref:FAD-binding protein n=1 Tax=Novilysobacter viscosus TaxID=3098602 RepID=UPI002ED8898A
MAWLQSIGVAFDQDHGRPRLGREGGHGAARIVHAGGDATGAAVMAALSRAARCAAHIEWHEGDGDVDALLMRGGRVTGVRLSREGVLLKADTVVLATGGIGALFARTSNPDGSDGAGLALALAAGAQPRDLEFMQFHPTAMDVGTGSLPLVTEALRGAGARLLDGNGNALMQGVHPQGDLAPRDIVARRVWQARHETGAAVLDARAGWIDWERRFPTALAACRAHGIDPRREPIPVTAAAHFHMGGVATDDLGRTSVPGLHAVGEVACNGVHGANRLASNSLLEGVVFGRRLGMRLAQVAPTGASGPRTLAERGPPLEGEELVRLRTTLWNAAGPVRTAEGMTAGLEQLAVLSGRGWQAKLAEAILAAALRRGTSLGAHWRGDSGVPSRQAVGSRAD